MDRSGFLDGFAAGSRSAYTVHASLEKDFSQASVVVQNVTDDGVLGNSECHSFFLLSVLNSSMPTIYAIIQPHYNTKKV